MSKYADLELGVYIREIGAYTVEYRYNLPDSETETRGQGKAEFDVQKLSSLLHDSNAYSRELTGMVFADPFVQRGFTEARTLARDRGNPLRVRLLIDPGASNLHNLRWEMLLDPTDDSPLTTNENLQFSRYLSSPDFRPVRLRSKGDLCALVVVANPSNLDEYRLKSIKVKDEVELARKGLGEMRITVLPQPDPVKHATLDNIITCLRDEEYDILYLVCHGAMVDGKPWLWLENKDGRVARTSGVDLVQRINELIKRPRLVVLASCQSAGDSSGEARAAIGPRLAETGIAAVLAMQGNISIQTVSEFMPVFFRELEKDGQVDRAVSVARGNARVRHDYWMPVLFMRLKDGRIWFTPGFTDPDAFGKWPSMIANIEMGKCTPILGSGLVEPLIGSHRQIAQKWAETYGYPMFPHERDSLPQVSQFLAIDQQLDFPKYKLEKHLKGEIQKRFVDVLPADLQKSSVSLDSLVQFVGADRRRRIPGEAHTILANLPLPVFITTNVNNLLESALEELGKKPRPLISPWNDHVRKNEPIYDEKLDFTPTIDNPLVYHLFGRLNDPESVVLTEDDYFNYLIGVSENKDLIPSSVKFSLVNKALLFLGFQLDDWNFRVLFQSLLSHGGKEARARFAHVAVQIEPEEERIIEPEGARLYLKNYFKMADINLYWGSAEDFLKELSSKLDA